VTTRKKEAARPCQVSKAAAITTTPTVYRQRNFFVKRNFPGSRNRRPPRPPAVSPGPASSAGVALGLLVLGLETATLPPRLERRAWGLVERWLGELVAARHLEVA
jgi:hypothetical protein